jgi:hypothetical protein
MTTIASKLRPFLQSPDIAEFARRLAEVEPGYYSNPELGHRVAGTSASDRAKFYHFITVLVETGELQSISAWHNQSPIRILHIEDGHLRDLFAEIL